MQIRWSHDSLFVSILHSRPRESLRWSRTSETGTIAITSRGNIFGAHISVKSAVMTCLHTFSSVDSAIFRLVTGAGGTDSNIGSSFGVAGEESVHERKVSLYWKLVFKMRCGSRNGNLARWVSVCGDKRVLTFWDYRMIITWCQKVGRQGTIHLSVCIVLLEFLVFTIYHKFVMMPGSIFSTLGSGSPQNFSCALFPSSLVTTFESRFSKSIVEYFFLRSLFGGAILTL